MKSSFFLRLALLNTFKKKMRVILAISGIALTASVIVVLFGLQIGLKNLVENEIRNGHALDVITVNQRNVQQIKLDESQVSAISSMSGVSEVAESVGLYGTGEYHGISLSAPVYAVSPTYFEMSPPLVVQGSAESEPQGTGIIVSTKVLDAYSIEPSSAVGKSITISTVLNKEYATKQTETESATKNIEYTIRGVIERGELPVFYIPIESIKEQGLDSVAQLNVRLTVPEKIASVRESIEQRGLQTTSVQDTIEQINKLFEVIQNILLVFGVIVFVITVSATFVIITLTLMEETRQIGFLRIMGLQHSDVKTLFIIQSMVITSLGAICGVIGGLAAGFIINGYAQVITEENSFSGTISVFAIPSLQVIMVLTLSLVIGWAVGIIPARRAVRINPLEELLL